MCSFSLFIKYFTDRFSLMRTWKRAPQLGTRISKFSRRYFFSLACVAMAILSSYYWSGFPFDNICPNEDIDSDYVGSFTVKGESVTFTNSSVDYRFCSQDLLMFGRGNTFPFVASKQPEGEEWMTDEQEVVTTIFGWSSVAITVLVTITFLWAWVETYKSLFYSSYQVCQLDNKLSTGVFRTNLTCGLTCLASLPCIIIRLSVMTRVLPSVKSLPEAGTFRR
jgi:hypothetical protein